MAVNFIKQIRAEACGENLAERPEAGQQASTQQVSGVVIRSLSERLPALPLLDQVVANQRNDTAPASPARVTVEQAGNELSNDHCPDLPLPNRALRQIHRLLGDDNDNGPRSLLRLYGNEGASGTDPLGQLNIMWLLDAREPIAPGDLSRATPPPVAVPLADGSPPSLPAASAPGQRKQSLKAAAAAFFHYPGSGDGNLNYGQWMLAHPLHRMFRQVYPLHGAIGSLEQSIDTPVHTILKGGIRNPLAFYQSLMVISEREDGAFTEFETLFRNAVAVSRNADGPLREQAHFFSRFFSALIALRTTQRQDVRDNIIETLRQEWLETDFTLLLGQPEASPPQAQWQAAEPVRTQVAGKRAFADAIGGGGMPPQKKQKTLDRQKACTPAPDDQGASEGQALPLHRHASTRTLDVGADTELSPPGHKYRSPTKPPILRWDKPALKRQAKFIIRESDPRLKNMAVKETIASPSPAHHSSVQRAGNLPVSGTTVTPAEAHGKTSSN
ncbi:hypothetical protein KTQ42_02775|uniref:hypothetical protein n=1 Tax=Noviherbaspirillum sp. L7-7A TaxID=2850560 RepID=UPI001C2CB00B|nr:hypothetical protein [Noviherbaspirillum sp. L7-7A]MBV0878229.1 hypothetical protein [Noviherbaspirillum sp. L7-7A]